MSRMIRQVVAAVTLVSLGACAKPPATASATPAVPPSPPTTGAAPVSHVRQIAEAITLGTHVNVVLTNGTRLTGALVSTDVEGFEIVPDSKVPEPSRSIAFADTTTIRPSASGLSTLGAFGLGILTGAGTVFGIILILVAHS